MGGFGVLGAGVADQFLPHLYALLGIDDFCLHEIAAEDLADFLSARQFGGLMVMGPFKEAVVPFCDALDPMAERFGAVNLLLVEQDGRLVGYNTEYDAFSWMVKRVGVNLVGAKVLVFGTGPASRAASAVVLDMGAKEAVAVSRHGEVDYTSVYVLHSDADVIVNTTPVGRYPDNEGMPIRLMGFRRCRGVLDMVHNPLRTMLLLEAEHRSIPCEGGLGMLVAEAKYAADLFCNSQSPESRIGEVCSKFMEAVCNIVLIGMPGSGKSFFGDLIAKGFGRELINMDDYIEQTQGVKIPEIFAKQGENAFREMEIAASKVLGCRQGLVISAGGGTVVRKASMDALRQNGCVFFVDRPLEELATDGRPLSQGGMSALQRLYDARIGLYTGYADVSILNTLGLTVEHIAQIVLREYEKVCAFASLPMWEQRN